MKKVVYSIRKVKGNFDEKISGLGFLNDEGTLFCKCTSQDGKRYTRAFDDVGKHCHKIIGKENECSGYVTMYYWLITDTWDFGIHTYISIEIKEVL